MSSRQAKRARALAAPVAKMYDARDREAYKAGMPLWRRIVGFIIPPLRWRWEARFDRTQSTFIRRTSKKASRAIQREWRRA